MKTYAIYQNLLAQVECVFRHCRQGSIQTRRRYKEAVCHFCYFLAEVYHVERVANIAPKHIFAYTEFLKENQRAIKTGQLTIKGKGGKIRTVPLPRTAQLELEAMLRQIPRGHKLFASDDTPTDLAINRFQCFLYRHRDAVQIADRHRPLTCHGLRHTYAVEQYLACRKQGLDEHTACRQVSRLLGHEREDVTRIYLASLREGGEKNG